MRAVDAEAKRKRRCDDDFDSPREDSFDCLPIIPAAMVAVKSQVRR